LVSTYLNQLKPEDTKWSEIPVSEVLSNTGGIDTGCKPPEPPLNIGHYRKLAWAKEILCIAIIPDFEVPTARAREVLPLNYAKEDLVFNLQRIALLPTALSESPPDAEFIYLAMQDKVHQPYRKTLIPGLTDILKSITPQSHPGLLGICLSGAGPTILCLATGNFEHIAEHVVAQFKKENITCEWEVLRPAEDGTTVRYTS
jgi:homoserine kinase